ncbi:hypothetical protein QTL95_03610 [Rhizobium sp. S152]|uniref:hypothetical protein n=1 Tax=Rhizobium sp. S152 TaxID=3055038 RepID=UPI0025A9A878|nr:hypothetical protein [Rhizobium sp. S152]MDM9624970.1 hypothetical protein [Rhizobium sp. S152]
MVEKVEKVSSTVASAATRIDRSVSLAEPDMAWVAERQSAINDIRDPRNAKRSGLGEERASEHRERGDDKKDADEPATRKLSGESDRIGTGNLDEDDVPFGGHIGFI